MKSKKPNPHTPAGSREHTLFDRKNYIWMAVGALLLAIGFLLMAGGKSDNPEVFSTDIYSFRRITLAPIIIVAGLVVEIYAIMKK